MSGASLNKELLAQGGRVVLETCASTHPKKMQLSDLKMLCKASLVLPLQEYLSFLLRFGYLKLDRNNQEVAITLDGQRLIKNQQIAKLEDQANKHFMSLLANVGETPRKKKRRRRAPTGRKRVPAPTTEPTTPAASHSSMDSLPPPSPVSATTASMSSSSAVPPLPKANDGIPPTGQFDDIDMSPTPTAPLPFAEESTEGTIGGRYQTVEMIGKGSVGSVFLARQIKMGREVVVKEMNGLAVLFPKPLLFKVIRRFARDMTRVATLSHPNIGTILDGNALKDQPYVVFEYLPGGSLQALLAENEYIPPETALPIFLQCLSALRYAHHRGVQHRNLKPSNILFDDSGNVCMVDFCMIPVMDREMARGPRQRLVSASSVAYIPPEVLADPTLRTEGSDLYSLGIILYEMLAGRLPGRRSPMPTDLYPDLPPIVDELFDRLTDDRPEDRFATADEVLDTFHSAEGFETLVDPSSAVLFWDIAPEEAEPEPPRAVLNQVQPEPPAVGIGRITAQSKQKPVSEVVREQPAEPKHEADHFPDTPPTTEVMEVSPDLDHVAASEPPPAPAARAPDVDEELVEPHDGELDEDDARPFLKTPAGIAPVAFESEDSLEIDVDVQAAVGQITSDGLDAQDEDEDEGGMEWEDGDVGRTLSSDDNTSLSWVKTGELAKEEPTLGTLEVTVSNSGDDGKMELMSPSEPIDDD